MSRLVILSLTLISFYLSACTPIIQDSADSRRKSRDYITQGVQHLRNNDLEKALAAFEVSFQLSANPAALDGMGCVAFRQGRYKRAQQYFLDASALDPNYSVSLGNLALLYQTMGNQKTASELYQKALSKDPDNFRARNNFAGLLIEYDQPNYAQQELFRASVVAQHPSIVRNLNNHGFKK
ncbi:MAG: tetratricopeptide repeat protein [Bdellovibrionota bacterium]